MSTVNRSVIVLGSVDAESRAAIAHATEAVAGTAVRDVADTSEILAEGHPAPILVIVSMHEAGASNRCAEMRSDTSFAAIPIVAIGDPTNALSFVELFHSGGDDLMSVAHPTLLVRRLRALTSRHSPRESAIPGADPHAVIAGTNSKWQTIVARALSNAGIPTRFVDNVADAVTQSQGAKVVVASEDLGPNGAAAAVAEARAAGSMTPWVIVGEPKHLSEIVAAVSHCGAVSVVDAFAPPESVLFVANDLANSTGADLRAAPRLLYGTTVAFRSAGREEDDDIGFTYNVSANGVFIRSLAPLQPGEDVWVELFAPRTSRRVRLAGKVVWRRYFGPNDSATVPAGFGVRLTDGLGDDLVRWQDGCLVLASDELRIRPSRFAPLGRSSYVPSLFARAVIDPTEPTT